MIQYIYFVKCPNCEDEHFDFFDEAKGFALGCLSKKPIITQTEVCRNDFGECTDSSDLGTVWSWEDECKDCQEPVEEPATFTKDDVAADYDPDTDPEFADDDSDFRFINELEEGVSNGVTFRNSEDFAEFKKLCDEIGIITMGDLNNFMKENDATDANILDKLREYRAELGPDFKIKEARKPVPEGMTIEQLVEEMEENEDNVECSLCNELAAKTDCHYDEDEGYICPECMENSVKCSWCGMYFGKDECRYEVDLGWLCDRCEAAIKSRGETLTFKENNYWDFIDEKLDIDTSNCVDTSDFEIWGINRDNKAVLIKRYENVDCHDRAAEQKIYDEMHDIDGAFVFMFAKDGSPILLSWNTYILSLYNGQEIIFDDARYDEAVTKALTRKFDECFHDRDPFDHHNPDYDEDEAADYMADLIDGAKDAKYDDAIDSLDESRDPFDHHDIDYDDEASADYLSYLSDKAKDEKYDDAIDSLDEGYNPSEEVELYYDDLTITVYGDRRDVDDWDESEHSGEYTYSVRKGNVANIIWENFITEEDVADVPGGLETLEDNYEWFKFLETHFDALFDKYYKDILKYYEEDAAEEFQDNYKPDDGPDPDAAYDAWRDEQ
jgi:hypothetical protein